MAKGRLLISVVGSKICYHFQYVLLVMVFVFLCISVYGSIHFQYHSFIKLTLGAGNKF
jgi:uncharacterized membrane protein YccC